MSALQVVLLLAASVGQSATLVSLDEALAAAFPGRPYEKETVFLTEAQIERIHLGAGSRPTSAMVTRFRVFSDGGTIGWAYVDTHRVRTLPETVVVTIDSAGAVKRVEVVAFREPPDYLPPESWYAQFDGHDLGEDLDLKRSIRPMTGATLTARATTDAVRRVLATHACLSVNEPSK